MITGTRYIYGDKPLEAEMQVADTLVGLGLCFGEAVAFGTAHSSIVGGAAMDHPLTRRWNFWPVKAQTRRARRALTWSAGMRSPGTGGEAGSVFPDIGARPGKACFIAVDIGEIVWQD